MPPPSARPPRGPTYLKLRNSGNYTLQMGAFLKSHSLMGTLERASLWTVHAWGRRAFTPPVADSLEPAAVRDEQAQLDTDHGPCSQTHGRLWVHPSLCHVSIPRGFEASLDRFCGTGMPCGQRTLLGVTAHVTRPSGVQLGHRLRTLTQKRMSPPHTALPASHSPRPWS